MKVNIEIFSRGIPLKFEHRLVEYDMQAVPRVGDKIWIRLNSLENLPFFLPEDNEKLISYAFTVNHVEWKEIQSITYMGEKLGEVEKIEFVPTLLCSRSNTDFQ